MVLLSIFTSYVKNFAVNRSVVLNGSSITAKGTVESTTRDFILAGLNADTPIAALNLSVPYSYEFAWHWITLTAYQDYGRHDSNLVLSSWCKVKILIFRSLFKKIWKWWGDAYFYLEKNSEKILMLQFMRI